MGDFTYIFPNFNGAAVKVWECINNFIPHFTGHMIFYPYYNYKESMLVKLPMFLLPYFADKCVLVNHILQSCITGTGPIEWSYDLIKGMHGQNWLVSDHSQSTNRVHIHGMYLHNKTRTVDRIPRILHNYIIIV